METLSHAQNALAGFTLLASIKASVLIVLVLLLQRLAGRHLSAHTRYFLWIAVVAGMVTPIGITTEIPWPSAWTISPPDPGSQSDVMSRVPRFGTDSAASLPNTREISGESPRVSEGLSAEEALPTVWLAGALLFLAVVLGRQWRFARRIRAATPADPALQALLDECRKLTGCRRAVPMLCTDAIETPLVTGCFRPRLLLPHGTARQLSERQLRHVFVHELMHIRHHDIAVNWLLTLVHAAHWFNPLVWIGFCRLDLDRELARDTATIACLAEDREQYGRTLLQLSQPDFRLQIAGALGVAYDHTQLRNRIMMLARGSRSSPFQSALAALLLLVLGSVAFSTPVMRSDRAAADAASVPMEVVSTRASVPAATIPAPAAAEIPTAIAQSIAASTPRIDSVIGTSIAADVPPAEVAVEQSSGEVLVDATAEPEAAQAEVTQAVQQTAIPEQAAGQSVAPPGGEGVTAAAETYRDWDDILKLARTVQDARKRGVGLLAEWNELAGKCESDPVEPPGCRDFRRGFKSGKLWSLSRQCDDLVGTYNRLAARIERADPSDFINANAIELAMADSYRALGDFCDVDIYRQKYQELWRVMRAGTIYRGLGPYWFTSTSPPYSGAP